MANSSFPYRHQPIFGPPEPASITRPPDTFAKSFGAQPAAPAVQGFTPSASLSPTNQLNELAAQMDPRMAAIREKNQMRHMTPIQQAAYTDRVVMQNEASLGDRSAQNRISLGNNLGPTIDGQYVNNRQYLSPEAKAVIGGARKQFNKEVTDLLSGANKQRWTTIKDFEDAVNALPAVQKYGGLIEDHIIQVARQLVSPQMKAQFDANDANVKEFIRWGRAQNLPFSDNDAILAEQYENSPDLRRRFEEDPNAKKFDATPDGKIQERGVSPAQQEAMKLAGISRDRDEANKAAREFVQNNPDYELVPGADPRDLSVQRKEKSVTEEIDAKVALEKYARQKYVEAGLRQPEDQEQDKTLTRSEQAEALVNTGVPIPMFKGKLIFPNDPIYERYVEPYNAADGAPIVDKVSMEAAENAGTLEFREKQGVEYFRGTGGTAQPAGSEVQASEGAATSGLPEIGTVDEGYRYKGGPVNSPDSWEQVSQEVAEPARNLSEAAKQSPEAKKVRKAIEPYYAEYSAASPEDRKRYGLLGIAYKNAKQEARGAYSTLNGYIENELGITADILKKTYDSFRWYYDPFHKFLFGEGGK